MNFTYGSAFAGYGGMTLGLKGLGGNGVVAWEFDPTERKTQYAQNAHKLLHQEIPVRGDICEEDLSNIPDFDWFCFTPPCQAFSVAGERKGFEDTRGTLIYEAFRIIEKKKPKVLFMENVKGLVGHDDFQTLEVIITSLSELGYVSDYTVINSKFFGVGQNRERVYLVAFREDLIKSSPWVIDKTKTVLMNSKRKITENEVKTFNFDWPRQDEVISCISDILEDHVDSKYFLKPEHSDELIREVSSLVEKNELDLSERHTSPFMVGHANIRGNDTIKRVYSENGICPTLTTMGGGHREPKIIQTIELNGEKFYIARKLTPRECLRLQSVPDDVIDLLLANFSDSRCYKFSGNGLTINVVRAIGEKIIKHLEGDYQEEIVYKQLDFFNSVDIKGG